MSLSSCQLPVSMVYEVYPLVYVVGSARSARLRDGAGLQGIGLEGVGYRRGFQEINN